MYYTKLSEKITADHAGQSAPEIAAALNAKSIAVSVPVRSAEIKKYLILIGKFMTMKSSDSSAAQVAIEVLNTFDVLNVQEAPVYGVLSDILSALVSANLLTTDDVTAIVSMGQEMQSWSQINLGIDVQEWQIQGVIDGN